MPLLLPWRALGTMKNVTTAVWYLPSGQRLAAITIKASGSANIARVWLYVVHAQPARYAVTMLPLLQRCTVYLPSYVYGLSGADALLALRLFMNGLAWRTRAFVRAAGLRVPLCSSANHRAFSPRVLGRRAGRGIVAADKTLASRCAQRCAHGAISTYAVSCASPLPLLPFLCATLPSLCVRCRRSAGRRTSRRVLYCSAPRKTSTQIRATNWRRAVPALRRLKGRGVPAAYTITR